MKLKELMVDIALGLAGTILLVEIAFLLYFFFDGCSFARDCIKAHNSVRRKHHVPPLSLHDEALEEATNWVQRLAGHKDKDAEHDLSGVYGQNIYFCKGFEINMTCADVVDRWYKEGANYAKKQPNLETEYDKYGHFSQVIWKSTKGLGCAKTQLVDEMFVVCSYFPAGNDLKQLGHNLYVASPAAPLAHNLFSIFFCFCIILWCFNFC